MRARAFIAAINDYPAASGFASLKGAVADALDFAEWALHPDGGNVSAADLYLWVYPEPDHMPDVVSQALVNRAWPASAARPDFSQPVMKHELSVGLIAAYEEAAAGEHDERLYVFFAGHGAVVDKQALGEDPQSCFVTADHLADRSFGLIPLNDVRRALERYGPTESFMFFDCCRNHFPITKATPTLGADESDYTNRNAQWLSGSGSAHGTAAFEIGENGSERGAFSKMLIQALRQLRFGDALTVPQLRAFTQRAVKELVWPSKQRPQLQMKDEDDQYEILRGPVIGDLPRLVVSLSDPAILPDLYDSKRELIQTEVHHGQVVTERLPLGIYCLESQQDSKIILHGGPGDTHVTF